MKVVLNTIGNEDCYEMVEDNLEVDEIFKFQICAGREWRIKGTCQGDT